MLGSSFKYFVEVNLEEDAVAAEIFASDFDIDCIVTALSEKAKVPIVPGQTLLFIDEIQKVS